MTTDLVVVLAGVACALAGGLGAVLVFRRHPRLAVVCWAVALFFTPVWFGVQVGIFITVVFVTTILVSLAFAGGRFRWSPIDALAGLLLLTVLAAYFVGGSPWGHIQEVLTAWAVPYVWGRLVLARVSLAWVAACLAGVAVVASVLAIVEFQTAQNLFFAFPGADSSVWGTQQIRAGLPRAEGAFGHSIALGGTLAACAVFVLSAPWSTAARVISLLVVGAGTVVTFSRIGLVGLALGVALSIVFLRRYIPIQLRVAGAVAFMAGALLALPFIGDVFAEAGSEAEGSALYRVDLLPLLGDAAWVGVSPSREVLATGEDYFSGFRSIDSALILIALRFGIIPMSIVVALLVVAIVAMVCGRGTPALVALIAQIPALATVALITQYTVVVWFLAGLAVASDSLIRNHGEGSWSISTSTSSRGPHRRQATVRPLARG